MRRNMAPRQPRNTKLGGQPLRIDQEDNTVYLHFGDLTVVVETAGPGKVVVDGHRYTDGGDRTAQVFRHSLQVNEPSDF